MNDSRVAICLFEPEITDVDSNELITGENLRKADLTIDTDIEAALFVRKSEKSIPNWVQIVQGFSEIDDQSLYSATSGAILFLKINDRVVACCFGTSIANINRSNIETDFGIGVVYIRMNRSQFKSVESFMLSNNPVTSNRRATIPTVRTSFSMDDLVENITEFQGYGYRKNRRIKLKGKEFFSSPSPRTFEDLVDLARNSLEDYVKAKNDEGFKQLTSAKVVKDKKLLDALDQELCSMVTQKSNDVFFADYDYLEDVRAYRFTPKGDKYSNLEVTHFYKSLRDNQIVTVGFLKTRKVFAFSEDEQHIDTWSLYKCLFVQIEDKNQTYILYKGKWYEIKEEYLNELKEFVRRYEVKLDDLPDWQDEEDEGSYNERASTELLGQCWDTKLYTNDILRYGIEFCDILCENKIYHVKKYKSSALNSHLLLQTAVSAELLANDIGLKQWIADQSDEHFGGNQLIDFGAGFQRSDITYYIVLLTQRAGDLADILPFFSLVSFNIMLRKIQQLGFNVKISKA
jgi:uncharacterized protein (TIGR04141 family)